MWLRVLCDLWVYHIILISTEKTNQTRIPYSHSALLESMICFAKRPLWNSLLALRQRPRKGGIAQFCEVPIFQLPCNGKAMELLALIFHYVSCRYCMSNTGSWSIWGAWLCLLWTCYKHAACTNRSLIVRWLPRLGLEKSKTFPIISWFILICDDSMIHVWWLLIFTMLRNDCWWFMMFYDCFMIVWFSFSSKNTCWFIYLHLVSRARSEQQDPVCSQHLSLGQKPHGLEQEHLSLQCWSPWLGQTQGTDMILRWHSASFCG